MNKKLMLVVLAVVVLGTMCMGMLSVSAFSEASVDSGYKSISDNYGGSLGTHRLVSQYNASYGEFMVTPERIYDSSYITATGGAPTVISQSSTLVQFQLKTTYKDKFDPKFYGTGTIVNTHR